MPLKANVDSQAVVRAGKVEYAGPAERALMESQVSELSVPNPQVWEQIKKNASRTVYRGQIDGQCVYLKHYHSRTLLHRLGRLMGGSDARREMHCMQHLSASGVQTAKPLAYICSNGTEWLASLAVAPAEPADIWHAKQLQIGQEGRLATQKVIVGLAEMIGHMHSAGVIHRDLHCGNVLVRTDGTIPRLVITDLHRVLRRRRLSRCSRAANIAQIFHDRYEFTTRTERLRFLKHYLTASGAEGTLRGWQLLVGHFAWRHRRGQHSQRDRRVFGDNRYFAGIKLKGGWRGRVVLASKRQMSFSDAAREAFTVEQWRQALSNPEELFAGPGIEVAKDSASSLVIHRKLMVGTATLDVFIKRTRRKYPWKILADCFRQSRPLRAFKNGHSLLTRRIATALPLVAIERRVGPLLRDSILITETVDGKQLHEFLSTWLAVPPRGDVPLGVVQQRQLAQDVLWQLGRMVQRLHDNQFAHRDLKANNIFITWSMGSQPEVVLIDLDGLSMRWYLSMTRKFQGLMRLNVSLLKCPEVNDAGRLRMLLGYLRRPGCVRINFKPYWRVLEQWSARKRKQQIRSRRRRQKAIRGPA